MKLTQKDIDNFAEIADQGAKNASQYLSTMTKKKFKVNIPWVGYEDYEKIAKAAGKKQKEVTAVLMQMSGEIKGIILMVFTQEAAIEISDFLTSRKKSKELDEFAESALMEAGGNILANAYLNAIAEKLNFKITDSVPTIATDMLGAIIGEVMGDFATRSEQALVFKNRFDVEGNDIDGDAYILFEPESFKTLIERMRKCKKK